jgi:hypothetical protein
MSRWTATSAGRGALFALCLGVGVVPASFAQDAPRARNCPRRTPRDGASCTQEGRACPYPCADEGDRDVHCTCTRGDDDTLRWRCRTGDVCES